MKHHEAMYTQYRPVRQTKMSTNMRYVPVCQTYCLPNILRNTVCTFSLLHITVKGGTKVIYN